MRYILCIILLLANKIAICQSSGSNEANDTATMSAPGVDVKNASTNFNNSWKTPVAENYDESHSVVRILDLSEKNNTVLTSIDSNTTITDLLINLLSTGKITAYADTLDTATIDNSKAIAYISKERNAIKNYMLFEFWELSYSKAKIFVRIVGIAPCVKKDTTFQPIVWFKYHSINNEFDKHKVSVARKKKIRHSKHNKLDVITLNDYFENRLFSGELMKGTNFWQVVLHNN